MYDMMPFLLPHLPARVQRRLLSTDVDLALLLRSGPRIEAGLHVPVDVVAAVRPRLSNGEAAQLARVLADPSAVELLACDPDRDVSLSAYSNRLLPAVCARRLLPGELETSSPDWSRAGLLIEAALRPYSADGASAPRLLSELAALVGPDRKLPAPVLARLLTGRPEGELWEVICSGAAPGMCSDGMMELLRIVYGSRLTSDGFDLGLLLAALSSDLLAAGLSELAPGESLPSQGRLADRLAAGLPVTDVGPVVSGRLVRLIARSHREAAGRLLVRVERALASDRDALVRFHAEASVGVDILVAAARSIEDAGPAPSGAGEEDRGGVVLTVSGPLAAALVASDASSGEFPRLLQVLGAVRFSDDALEVLSASERSPASDMLTAAAFLSGATCLRGRVAVIEVDDLMRRWPGWWERDARMVSAEAELLSVVYAGRRRELSELLAGRLSSPEAKLAAPPQQLVMTLLTSGTLALEDLAVSPEGLDLIGRTLRAPGYVAGRTVPWTRGDVEGLPEHVKVELMAAALDVCQDRPGFSAPPPDGSPARLLLALLDPEFDDVRLAADAVLSAGLTEQLLSGLLPLPLSGSLLDVMVGRASEDVGCAGPAAGFFASALQVASRVRPGSPAPWWLARAAPAFPVRSARQGPAPSRMTAVLLSLTLQAGDAASGPDAVGPDAVGPDAVGPDAVGPDAVDGDALLWQLAARLAPGWSGTFGDLAGTVVALASADRTGAVPGDLDAEGHCG